MLIRFFSSSFYQQYVLLLLLAAALWLPAFRFPVAPAVPGMESPLAYLLANWLTGWPFAAILAVLLLVLAEALILNHILIRHELVPKNTLVPAALFLVLMSQLPALADIFSLLPAVFFTILALGSIFNTYGQPDPTGNVFSAAFLLALASLFHFASIFLLLILFLSLMLFGTFSGRIMMVSLAGFTGVYLYLFLYHLLNDTFMTQWELYAAWFSGPGIMKPLNACPLQMIAWGWIGVLLLLSAFRSFSRMQAWNISVRKKMLLLMWFALIAIASLLYEAEYDMAAPAMAAVPAAAIIAAGFTERQKTPLKLELLFWILLIITFANNWFKLPC